MDLHLPQGKVTPCRTPPPPSPISPWDIPLLVNSFSILNSFAVVSFPKDKVSLGQFRLGNGAHLLGKPST
jgi:hypothetical protein